MTDLENKMRASFEQSLAKEYERRGYFGPIGGQHSAETPLPGNAPEPPDYACLRNASVRLFTVANSTVGIRDRLATLHERLTGISLASDKSAAHTPAPGVVGAINHQIQRLDEAIAGIDDLLDKLDEII